MTIQIAELYNWSIVSSDMNPYLAPEARKAGLRGQVYNHPTFSEGEKIVTSPVIFAWEDKRGKRFVQTKNTIYELLTIDEAYLYWLEEQGKTIDLLFAQFKKDM